MPQESERPPSKKAKVQDHFGTTPVSWRGGDVVSQAQFTAGSLELLFRLTDRLKADVRAGTALELLKGKLLACAFMEPSTRTSCSFQAAAQRLGATSILINSEGSSAKKGETLEDTMRCLECYADALVLRHPEQGSVRRAADACAKPVLNAGDGVGEHPTQALLDVYTMRSEILAGRHQQAAGAEGRTECLLNGIKVALVGDLKHGRTVHSLATMLARVYNGVELHFVSPPQLEMPQAIADEVTRNQCKLFAHQDLQAVIGSADVLYITRVQKERFSDPEEYERLKLRYIVTPEVMEQAKESLVLMHPLPRVGEIDPNVDDDPRAAYFRQMENGMFVRMALLALVMGADVESYLEEAG